MMLQTLSPPLTQPTLPLHRLLSDHDLAATIALAAREARCAVAGWVGTLRERAHDADDDAAPARVELAVEYVVPPADPDALAGPIDAQLAARCLGYARGRAVGEVARPSVRHLPAGTLHQWRVVWRWSEERLLRHRWGRHRCVYDSVIEQAVVGWREIDVRDESMGEGRRER